MTLEELKTMPEFTTFLYEIQAFDTKEYYWNMNLTISLKWLGDIECTIREIRELQKLPKPDYFNL